MAALRRFRLPQDIPLEEYPRPEIFLEEAQHLVDEAQQQSIILRVMGPIALHYYFPEHVDFYRRMERLGERVFTDIDFASYSKYRGKVVDFFERRGFEIEKRALMVSGGARHIYFSERIPMVDVFFDRLVFNHTIEYKGRLEIHPLCVSLSDLLLQKLQIVQINIKDLKDAMLLLLAGQVGESDQNMINAHYLANLFAADWGFYYTSVTNLKKIIASMDEVPALMTSHRNIIREKVEYLVGTIEKTPKSKQWHKRAKVGTSKPWYNDVPDWI